MWRAMLYCCLLALVASSYAYDDSDFRAVAQLATLQQFSLEQLMRSNGNSGIRVMRQRGEGTKPYHGTSHADDKTFGSIHNHPDFNDTCGMGEVSVVLNGVAFRTRHNDFLLARRADVGGAYDDTVAHSYPDVPQSVLDESTVTGQISEMRKYFQAFQIQNQNLRDYRDYFKAHLCYMEGAWTVSDPQDIQEAFFSERHSYAASSWDDLFQKKRYESYSGTKENLENFAFMPRTLWNIEDDGSLVYGQWNYKILCHKLLDDLPLNRLRYVDDLKTRMSLGVTYQDAMNLRNAHYQVNPVDSGTWEETGSQWGFLDKLMEQIPGPNGYNSELEDDAFDNTIKDFDAPIGDETAKNVAYYHRWFQNLNTGAMGSKVRKRGFHDEHMWVAMTTQSNVLPSRLEQCIDNDCQSWEQKWVYAIPMEIIYTTPLHNWNPYGIEYKGRSTTTWAQTVFDGPNGSTRDGSVNDVDIAYNGTNSAAFYQTPFEFFDELTEFGDDPADTPADYKYVLDPNGSVHKVRASGIRTYYPDIKLDEDIGRMRQRYPIAPLHGEGNPIWMELAALKEIVLNPTTYSHMLQE